MASEEPTNQPERRPGATLSDQKRARRQFISPPCLAPIVRQPETKPSER